MVDNWSFPRIWHNPFEDRRNGKTKGDVEMNSINFSNVSIDSMTYDLSDNSFAIAFRARPNIDDNLDSFNTLKNRSFCLHDLTLGPAVFNPIRIKGASWVESENKKISAIRHVISNGPATIIIDNFGRKTVVKLQDDSRYSKLLGFYMCLLRYILDKKRYHEVVEDIFENHICHKAYAARSLLLCLLGKKEVEKLIDRFHVNNKSQE